MTKLRNIMDTGAAWMSRVLMFVDARLGRGSRSLDVWGSNTVVSSYTPS
jgi:hypothetical protein